MRPDHSSKRIDNLVPAMQSKAMALLAACRAKGVQMAVDYTLRGPAVQAALWCQSRNAKVIESARARMIAEGAPWLASLLRFDGLQRKDWVTNALPGESWHQWGEAIDCYVLDLGGKYIWNGAHKGYGIYAECAVNLGLEASLNWQHAREAAHVQLRKDPSARKELTWVQIEEEMKKRFGA
jgi:peptidoglycan LD-endopeptidase CwlK